jgi:hypothetical protein
MATFYRADCNADRLTTPTEGWCLTDDETAAAHYARAGGTIAVVDLDMAGLFEILVDGYDRVENETPADSAAFRAHYRDAEGADVLTYDDETDGGRQHTTWRIVSDRAIAACRVVEVRAID